MNDKQNNLASSSFYLDITLSSDMVALKATMKSFPGAKLISEGTTLKYILKGKSERDDTRVEISRSNMAFTYYYERPSLQTRNLNLVKLLSFLAYLGSICDPHLQSLYPSIIESLEGSVLLSPKEDGVEHTGSKLQINELSKSNLSLSHELFFLNKRLSAETESSKCYKELCEAVLDRFSDGNNSVEALMRLGLSEESSKRLVLLAGRGNERVKK